MLCNGFHLQHQKWTLHFIVFLLCHVIRKTMEMAQHSHFYWLHSRGNNTFGSIHVCVRPFVCGHSPVWTVWPLTLIFGMMVDLDLGYPGNVGHRSKVKVKQWKIALPFKPVVRIRSILGLGLPSSANGNCKWPLPVHWNCLFVSNQGVFNV